jgi:hypothetical protein
VFTEPPEHKIRAWYAYGTPAYVLHMSSLCGCMCTAVHVRVPVCVCVCVWCMCARHKARHENKQTDAPVASTKQVLLLVVPSWADTTADSGQCYQMLCHQMLCHDMPWMCCVRRPSAPFIGLLMAASNQLDHYLGTASESSK